MKYNQPVAIITIRTTKKIDFLVPAELAILLFWFLTSKTTPIAALVLWRLTGDFIQYMSGWIGDLFIIWLALGDWQGWLMIFGEVLGHVGQKA